MRAKCSLSQKKKSNLKTFVSPPFLLRSLLIWRYAPFVLHALTPTPPTYVNPKCSMCVCMRDVQRGDPRRKLHKVPAGTRQTWRRGRRRRNRWGHRRSRPAPRTSSNQGFRNAQTDERRPEVGEPANDGAALVQLDRLRGGRRRGRGLRRRAASHMRNLHLGGLWQVPTSRGALPPSSSSSRSSSSWSPESQSKSAQKLPSILA